MDYGEIVRRGGDMRLLGVRCFSLDETLDCGQCFRWEKQPDGVWQGVALGKLLRVSQRGETVVFHDTAADDFAALWHGYFDLGRDYAAIQARACADEAARAAILQSPGIRVLRQDPWEALCSFIISQNNHIPRIKGIIARLCEAFGAPLGGGAYAFPPARVLAGLAPEALAPLRCGFRAKYILDAARKVASGAVDLEALRALPPAQAQAALEQIKGVGPKVARCALLYGLGKAECMPVDVWMKRVLARFYPEGFPPGLCDCAGIVQQYLFHYIRGAGADSAQAVPL